MSQQDFIIWVFCWVDDNLTQLQQGRRCRSRGYPTKLSDAEAITMEVVGEFLGFSTDKGIWTYFNDHWHEWFPGLGSRANFAKQISHLWVVKQQLQEKLARLLGALDDSAGTYYRRISAARLCIPNSKLMWFNDFGHRYRGDILTSTIQQVT